MSARDKANTPGQLSGHVEIDETYVGGKIRGKGSRYVKNKTVAIGMVQRGGAFKGFVVENDKKTTLIPHIVENVAKDTMINTDTLAAYKCLSELGYQHEALNHTFEESARGIHHTNRIEGFWSHLKRGIKSTHVSVSTKWMQNYVDEFSFRYNNRQAPADMFQRMLAHIAKLH